MTMKYLVISDVHGSVTAMEQLEKIYLEQKCDKIICLGDILYHGPRNDLPEGYAPKKVIEIVKKYIDDFIWVQGNCDAEVDEMVLGKEYTKIKKIKINHRNVYLTHGHHLSRFEPSSKLEKGDIVLYGHYHVFNITEIDNVTYINIGSPSIPKDGEKQYAIIDGGKLTVFNLDGKILGCYQI